MAERSLGTCSIKGCLHSQVELVELVDLVEMTKFVEMVGWIGWITLLKWLKISFYDFVGQVS